MGGRAHDTHEEKITTRKRREKIKINDKVKKRRANELCARHELNMTPRKHMGKWVPNPDTDGGEQSTSRPGHFNPSNHCTSGV
jgi:hypothetical protein